MIFPFLTDLLHLIRQSLGPSMLWQMVFFMAEYYSTMCVHIPYTRVHTTSIICSSGNGHTGCFHILPIVNSATLSTGVRLSFQISVSAFSGYMPRSRTAGSYGSYF